MLHTLQRHILCMYKNIYIYNVQNTCVFECRLDHSVIIVIIFSDNMHAVADKLYAVGGYDGQERLNTVEVFDPVVNRWKLVKPMLCKRR